MNNNTKKPNYNLEITVTPRCNMACTYCFEGEQLQSKKKQTVPPQLLHKTIIEISKTKSFQKDYGGFTINFWGGEPTTKNNIIMDYVDECIKIQKDTGIIIDYFIYSNGYALANSISIIEFFKSKFPNNWQNKFSMQISYDGEATKDLRVNHSAKPTYQMVKRNIKVLIDEYPNINLSLKATVEPKDLLKLPEIYIEYQTLYEECIDINNRFYVSLSPTLNYIDDFEYNRDHNNNEITEEEYLKQLNKVFQIVLQKEIIFYNYWGDNLFGWFNHNISSDTYSPEQKRQTNCSAGISIGHIDLDGNLSVCHGSEYSEQKWDFITANINMLDEQIPNKQEMFRTAFDSSRKQLQEVHGNLSKECIECSATVCYKCPIVNVEQQTERRAKQNKLTLPNNFSKLNVFNTGLGKLNDFKMYNQHTIEGFQKRDPRHCKIYKAFGIYDHAFYKYLKKATTYQNISTNNN